MLINSRQAANSHSWKDVLTYLSLGVLLFLLCARVWHFGITHTDDAMWAMPGYVNGIDPVSDWAISQGRLWAYVSGSLIFFTLQLQGSVWGEVLRLGSFVAFFLAFYGYLAVLVGRNFSLLSASFFLAFFMLKWDGSILTTYPLITWVAGLTFIASLELSRRYVLERRSWHIPVIAVLLFFSLFNNEGITLLFICLFFAHVLYLNAKHDGSMLRFQRLNFHQRSLILFALFFIVAASYSILYLGWMRLHPSVYDGHKLSGFNVNYFLKTLFHFSTSGSALHDLVSPYSVPFGDTFTMTGKRVEYFLTRNLQRSLHQPLALTACIITMGVLWVQIKQFLSTQKSTSNAAIHPAVHSTISPSLKKKLGIALIVGLSVAIIPIVPVALTSKYQNWMAENAIRAYSHTLFSHFGWSCVYAAVLLFILDTLKHHVRVRAVLIGLVVVFSGLVASQAFTANDDMAADMRNETGRWQMLARLLALNDKVFQQSQAWSPRFSSGSWYGTLHKDYWSQYAEKRYGSKTKISVDSPTLAQQKAGYLLHDYVYDRFGKRFVALAMPKLASGVSAGKSQLAIYIEGGILQHKGDYFLHYIDRQGREARIDLNSVKSVDGERDWGVIDDMDADFSALKLMRLDADDKNYTLCGLSLPRGILFSTLSDMVADRGPAAAKTEASGQSLRFKLNDTLNLVEGWSAVEPNGAWSVQNVAKVRLPWTSLPAGEVHFRLQFMHLAGQDNHAFSQTLTIKSHDAILGSWTFKPPQTREVVEFVVSRSMLASASKDEVLELSFEVSPLVNQKTISQGRDTRDLGIFVESLEVGRKN